jgi:hypothetical protein
MHVNAKNMSRSGSEVPKLVIITENEHKTGYWNVKERKGLPVLSDILDSVQELSQ